jgi:bacterioferritin-associated ferredoxin
MIVCLCNAIREDEVRKAAREGAACTRSVYRAIGRKPRCGQCLPFAKEIIAAERATAKPSHDLSLISAEFSLPKGSPRA